ncbi:hypothetical protein NMG60_11026930 [Bertholletia excelsa]
MATATTTVTFLSLPIPSRLSVSQRGFNGQSLSSTRFSVFQRTPFSSLSASSSSSSSSSVVVEDDGPPPPPEDLTVKAESPTTEDSDLLPPTSGCQACGRDEIEKGCNGEGRIQGGIATVPGFGWWPIKAYRPCPGFVASGGRYRRQGQSMDEIGFGGGNKAGGSLGSNDKTKTSNKKPGPRKFKP